MEKNIISTCYLHRTRQAIYIHLKLTNIIVANRPYLGGTVPIFYAKYPNVPIFLNFVPNFSIA